MKNTKSKIATFTLTVLLVTSAFSILLSSSETTVKAAVPSDMLQYEWTNPRSTPQGTFFSDGPAPNTASIQWKTQITGIGGTMAAFNGFVFASAGGYTYAMDASNGNIVWKTAATGNIYKLNDEYMMIGNKGAYTGNGTIVWTAPDGFRDGWGDVNSVGYVAEIGMFLTSSQGYNLADPSQAPTLAWNLSSTANVAHLNGIVSSVYGDGKIFVYGYDGFLRARDAKTAELIWSTPTTSTSSLYGLTYDNGRVFHGGLDNNMHCWDANTGELLWTYNPGTFYGLWASSTAAAYGMVFEHNQDTYLYAINQTNGQLVWRAKGPGIGYSNILGVADGKVYCQMGEKAYRDFETGEFGNSEYDCFNAYTGELIWTMPVENGAPANRQCIAYGNLYICPTISESVPGYWTYFLGSLNEIWCIGSTPKDWPMFMADPTHTGEGAGPANLKLAWKFDTGAQVVSPATIVNGVCYVGSMNGKIYALDATTGTKIWESQTDYQVASQVAVVNGKVYTGADDGNIYCLDAATGSKLWTVPAGGITVSQIGNGLQPPIRSSPVVDNGKVYVGSLDGNLYCIDASSDSVLWKFQTGGQILATPAVDSTGVYVPANTPGLNGTFYKLNADEGSVIWQIDIPYLAFLTPVYDESGLFASPVVVPSIGTVFLRNGIRTNYAINMTTGGVMWIHNFTKNPGSPFQSGGVIQVGAPLYAYGAVYINDYFSISCINAFNGSEIWNTWLSREDLSQGISYSYGRIYVVTELGVIYVLDSQTGAKISYYELGSPQMHAMPTLYNGNLFVGTNDWNVYCFEEAPPPEPYTPPPEPTYPTAEEVAQKVIDSLPDSPIADEVAQAVLNQLPEEPEPAEYTTTDIVIIVAVVIAIIIGFVNFYLIRKRK